MPAVLAGARGRRQPGGWCPPKYEGSTKRIYVNAWERFDEFCDRVGARALPASPEAVVRYMASLFDKGTCAPDIVGSYLAAIRAVHRVAGLPSPTDDPLVADARVGYRVAIWLSVL